MKKQYILLVGHPQPMIAYKAKTAREWQELNNLPVLATGGSNDYYEGYFNYELETVPSWDNVSNIVSAVTHVRKTWPISKIEFFVPDESWHFWRLGRVLWVMKKWKPQKYRKVFLIHLPSGEKRRWIEYVLVPLYWFLLPMFVLSGIAYVKRRLIKWKN